MILCFRTLQSRITGTLAAGALLWAGASQSQPYPGWDSVVIDNSMFPLELRIGSLTDAVNTEIALMALWNLSPGVNRIGAFRMDPPYNGLNVTFDNDIVSGPLFALGDMCAGTNRAVVPYVNGSSLDTAKYNGVSWSTSTLAAGGASGYDSADCGVASTGMYITAHNRDFNRIDIFRSSNDGLSFTLWDTLTDTGGIEGPFNGAVRDTLLSHPSTDIILILYMRADGGLYTQTIDTDPSRGPNKLANCNVGNFAPPIGFNGVKESGCFPRSNTPFKPSCAHIAEGTLGNIARGYITIDSIDNCSTVFPNEFGAPPPVGMAGFHGTGGFPDGTGNANVLWGDYFYLDHGSVPPGGDPLVHVEPYPGEVGDGPSAGGYTYYGRYSRGLVADAREPLGTVWSTRYNDVSFSGGLELNVWRDTNGNGSGM